jgi:hypothetical protein
VSTFPMYSAPITDSTTIPPTEMGRASRAATAK